MIVVDVQASQLAGLSPKELLALAVAVEQFSDNPIAKAILTANHHKLPKAGEFQSLRGLGVSAF